LRIRPRPQPRPEQPPGQIAFDERGNAVYSWSEHLTEDSEDGERARRNALDHPDLSMVDDEPPHNAPIRHNRDGARTGYNPYESGLLAGKAQPKKQRDLRELSKWLQMKRKLGERPPEE
jgi:hypothetical protein